MSEEEFEVIDQLYFVTSYKDLNDSCNLNESKLLDVLISLSDKGWVKCYAEPDKEIALTETDLKKNHNNYEYLATKQGLLAHNMR